MASDIHAMLLHKKTTVFGLPLLSASLPDSRALNESLASLILTTETNTPTAKRSNVGGWRSQDDVHTWDSPPIRSLLEIINSGVSMLMSEMIGTAHTEELSRSWSIIAWANVSRANDFNAIHYHGGFWSGVYYVSVGNDIGDGADGSIVFRNPTAASMIAGLIQAPALLKRCFSSELNIRPTPGLLLVFPSWLEHWVRPHRSQQPRISVAFNVSFNALHPG